MANKREVSHKYLSGKSRYDYCPFCVKQIEEEGITDWLSKEKLKPLKRIETVEPILQSDGSYREYYDHHYECIKCGNTNINTNTFYFFYCRRADGTKYNEPRKEPGLVWSKTKDCLVPAKWNNQKQCWEEIIDNSGKS